MAPPSVISELKCRPVPKPNPWAWLLLTALLAAPAMFGWWLPNWAGETGGRNWAFILFMISTTFLLIVLGLTLVGRAAGVLIDSQNRMSLSRLQTVIWTVIVLSAFGAAALSNMSGDWRKPGYSPKPLDIAVPRELWIIMGISIASLVGTPLILGTKQGTGADGRQLEQTIRQLDDPCAVNDGQLLKKKCPECAGWQDLFQGQEVGNASDLDLSKVQMLFFTFILVVAYVVAIFSHFAEPGPITRLPVLSEGAVALLAISHAGHLLGQGAPNSQPGNVRDPLSDTEIQTLLNQAHAAREAASLQTARE
jgi:hypothetical protein